MQCRRPIPKCKTPFGYRLGDKNANVCNEVPANFAAVSRQLYDTEDGPLYSSLDQTLVNRLFEETKETDPERQLTTEELQQQLNELLDAAHKTTTLDDQRKTILALRDTAAALIGRGIEQHKYHDHDTSSAYDTEITIYLQSFTSDDILNQLPRSSDTYTHTSTGWLQNTRTEKRIVPSGPDYDQIVAAFGPLKIIMEEKTPKGAATGIGDPASFTDDLDSGGDETHGPMNTGLTTKRGDSPVLDEILIEDPNPVGFWGREDDAKNGEEDDSDDDSTTTSTPEIGDENLGDRMGDGGTHKARIRNRRPIDGDFNFDEATRERAWDGIDITDDLTVSKNGRYTDRNGYTRNGPVYVVNGNRVRVAIIRDSAGKIRPKLVAV
jgi:hypothetical protein